MDLTLLTAGQAGSNIRRMSVCSATITKDSALSNHSNRGRGQPRKPDAKINITLRLSPDVLERWRGSGPGWQARMDNALRSAALVDSGAPVID